MSYDAQTDAIIGRLNDWKSALNGSINQAAQLSTDAKAIHMADLGSILDAQVADLQGQLAAVQNYLTVANDIKVST